MVLKKEIHLTLLDKCSSSCLSDKDVSRVPICWSWESSAVDSGNESRCANDVFMMLWWNSNVLWALYWYLSALSVRKGFCHRSFPTFWDRSPLFCPPLFLLAFWGAIFALMLRHTTSLFEPGPSHQPVAGPMQTLNYSHLHYHTLFQINYMHISECGTKPVYSEKSHTGTGGSMQTPPRKSRDEWFQPQTSLWGGRANH